MPRGAIMILVGVLYPIAIYLAQGRVAPRVLAGALGVIIVIRFASQRSAFAWGWMLAALALVTVVMLSGATLPLKLYPVFVNAGLLGVFAWSLYAPPTVIERFVRARGGSIPPAAEAYVRRVTAVWCAFFLVNGAIALATALYASTAIWSLYNGVIAYGAMGLLFAGEYAVRRRVMERVGG